MNKKSFYLLLTLSAVIVLLPETVAAVDTTKSAFGAGELHTHANTIQDFLFGPLARVAAIMGGAVGIIRGYLQQSIAQMATFGGIILTSAVLPKMINAIYTVTLP